MREPGSFDDVPGSSYSPDFAGSTKIRALALDGKRLSSPNHLSLIPRVVREDETCFESDGPGRLSIHGPRHDNDHVEIRAIRIFPTTDEILSHRRPYMPQKSMRSPHRLPPGPERLTDILFRQLRYESLEILTDCTYHAAQQLAKVRHSTLENMYYQKTSQDTPQGNRYNLFWNAEIECLSFDERRGLIVEVSHFRPRVRRQESYEPGMVVALVGLDADGVGMSVTPFSVHKPVLRMGGKRASVELCFAEEGSREDVRRIVYYKQSIRKGRFVLVEVPKFLLQGFYPILRCIQGLNPSELKFTDHIAPRNDAEIRRDLQPPSYTKIANAHLDFSFPKPTTGIDGQKFPLAKLTSDQNHFLKTVRRHTTLDEGQAQAFVDSMSRQIAMVQGPPGTGKTYLGTALAKAILSDKENARYPILAICTTNHALDNFLDDLRKSDITEMVRIGAGSKEEWVRQYTLTNVRKSAAKRKEIPKVVPGMAFVKRNASTMKGEEMCQDANLPSHIGWSNISTILRSRYPDIYRQFNIVPPFQQSLKIAGRKYTRKSFPYAFWSMGGDLNPPEDILDDGFVSFLQEDNLRFTQDMGLSTDPLKNICKNVAHQMHDHQDENKFDIWALPHEDRVELIKQWSSEINIHTVANEIVAHHFKHLELEEEINSVFQEADSAILAKAQVIGLTTSACPRMLKTLKGLKIKVVICEEAGEVMESHSLCTFFPSLEHAIFIGDPFQLRPRINERSLSIETTTGSKYRLDESLFERIAIDPSASGHALPYSKLNIQRRMHPDISATPKEILYPLLRDHESTLEHPEAAGFCDRTYWFHHTAEENDCTSTHIGRTGMTSKNDAFGMMRQQGVQSHTNMFEVGIIAGLVRYLVGSNAYGLGDIAILTPYNGQLGLLFETLRAECSVWLNTEDRQKLVRDGVLRPYEEFATSRITLDMQKILRISTVDNFQGEEAKVVIFSAVRSNQRHNPGFLKSLNRINVACSRARDGFFIIGNATTLATSPHWEKIIQLFRARGQIGSSFRIKECPNGNHPGKLLDVASPKDLLKVEICRKPCNSKLDCGHQCREPCHPLRFHEHMRCNQRCGRIIDSCGHTCSGLCREVCGPCVVPVLVQGLQCGHSIQTTCGEETRGRAPLCDAFIDLKRLKCGHSVPIHCFQRDNEEKLQCGEICKANLECGHTCGKRCRDCSDIGHGGCRDKCDRVLLECGHTCEAICHEGRPCPPCRKPCEKRCQHRQCPQMCGQCCELCLRTTVKGCSHRGPINCICSLPIGLAPCNEPATKTLPCGHDYITVCGEPLVSRCVQCHNKENAPLNTESQPAVPMVSLSCGHVIPVKEMDAHVGIHDILSNPDSDGIVERVDADLLQNADLTCPVCSHPIDDLNPRYHESLTRLRDLPMLLDQALLTAGQHLAKLCRRLAKREVYCRLDSESITKALSPSPFAIKHNMEIIRDRTKQEEDLQKLIVSAKETIFGPLKSNLYRLETFLDKSILPRSNVALSARCALLSGRNRYIFFKEQLQSALALTLLPNPSIQLRIVAESLRRIVKVQSSREISALEETIDEAKRKNCKTLEVESRILQLNLYCLYRRANSLKTALDESGPKDDSPLTPSVPAIGLSTQNTAIVKHRAENGDNDDGTGLCPLDIEANFKRIEALCRTYPHSAGKLLSVASELRRAVYTSLRPNSIFSVEIMQAINAWLPGSSLQNGAQDEHDDDEQLLKIARCDKHAHVYPVRMPANVSFVHDEGKSNCPECGLQRTEKPKDSYETYLREDEFMARVRQLSLHS